MRKIYTDKQIEFLRKGFLTMGIPDLTRVFNKKFKQKKTDSAIQSALKNRKITCGRTTGDLNKGRSHIFTPPQVDFIKNNYIYFSQKDLTDNFNQHYRTEFTEQQIRSFTRNHKIKSGRTGRFERGRLPWKTGTKGICHGSSTSFTLGNTPPNTRPLGAERVDTKDGYILVKVDEPNPFTTAQTRFKHKHVVIWESKHGPVPSGLVIIFKDGDKLNFDDDNLIAVSRAELLRLNQYNYKKIPGVLRPGVLALAKLEVKTFSLARA
jgi:hypothetical protein